jgi:hypothetical protein
MFLFACYLGGPLGDGRMGEDHEVVLVVAADATHARRQARAKWSGVGRPHVDAVQRVSVVDGHAVSLTPEPGATGDVFELEGYNE